MVYKFNKQDFHAFQTIKFLFMQLSWSEFKNNSDLTSAYVYS